MIRSFVYTADKLEFILSLDIAKAELDELKAQGIAPKEAIKQSLENSIISWYILDESDELLGVGGIARHEINEGHAKVWFLAKEGVMRKHLFSFNSLAFDGIEFAFNKLGFYCLCNHVSLQNKLSIKWLKSLGFSFMQNYVYFKDKSVIFDEFYLYKEDYECVT